MRVLTSGLPPLHGRRGTAGVVWDLVAGPGPLQRYLDDPRRGGIWINQRLTYGYLRPVEVVQACLVQPILGRYAQIFAALDDADVRYVIVGGLAVVLHGHARLTVDLDLVLDLATGPSVRAVAALSDLGLRPRLPVTAADFADATIRQSWIVDRNLQVFSLHDPDDPRREVDLFAEAPLPFEDLYAASDLVDIGDMSVRVASIEDLIVMKVAAGRPQDLADVEALRGLKP